MHLALLAIAMFFMACGVLGWKLSRHTPTLAAEDKSEAPGLTPASPPSATALPAAPLPDTGGPPNQQSMHLGLLALAMFFMACSALGWKLSRGRP
jgi:hypothetical protein